MISRLATIHDDSGGLPGQTLASYAYSGLGRLAVEEFPQPEVRLDYFQGTSGLYAGLDRFGRTKDQRWRFTGQTPADRDRYRYGHDYASNRLWRENALTHGTANQFDEAYAHDGLHRLQDAARGTLDDPPSEGLLAKTFEQAWGLDQVGNWPSFKEGDGTNWTLEQAREHNKANEIETITDGAADWVDPVHDARGNMTSGPKPGAETTRQHFVWDAWDRLVKVHADDGQGGQGDLVATYSYDGTRRRIRRAVEGTPDVAYDYFYSGYQVVEVRKDQSANPYEQYVWGARYVHSPVCRWYDADADGQGVVQHYYLNDANFNVTALVESDGDVAERVAYDPYGKPTFYDGNWQNPSGESAVANTVLFTGHRLDPESGLYHTLWRYYHPTLGRCVSRDQIGYADGMHSYAYVGDQPISKRDRSGRSWQVADDGIWQPEFPLDESGNPVFGVPSDIFGEEVPGPWLPPPPERSLGTLRVNLLGEPGVRGESLGIFKVTAYNTSHEADFPQQPKVMAKGLGTPYSREFLRDVRLQGSGIDLQGRKFQLDWSDRKSYVGGAPTAFRYVDVIRTRDGSPLVAYRTIATDPSVIPQRMWVYIDTVGWRQATDTGGRIRGRHIDLYMEVPRAEALAWGVKHLCVWKEKR